MSVFTELIQWNPVSRMRRNHALEHASLHILAKKKSNQFLAGHSDVKGLRIIGNVPTEDIQQAVEEALSRLQSGEKDLAYHPNCGTNFTTSGALAGLAAWAGFQGGDQSSRGKFERLPAVMLLVTLALVVTRPLGPYLQQNITTDPRPGSMKIVEIQRHDFGDIVFHRILTAD
jgi:hypothetical protein